MEPTVAAGVGTASGVRPVAGPVVQIDEVRIQAHLDEVVRSTVEETLNALLDAEAARLSNLQNRPGFLIKVTVEAAKRVYLMDAVARLEPWLHWLREARLYREDTLCKKSMTQVERRRLRRSRPQAARFWRLLTDLNAKEVADVVKLKAA